MPQLQYTPELLRKSIKLLFSFICLLALFQGISAQSTQQWFYVARDRTGTRFFVQKKVDSLNLGRSRGMWTKIVYSDWSEKIIYNEWDCKKRRYRTKQASSYTSDGKFFDREQHLEWVLVTPEDISEALFEEACGTPQEIKYAQIIVPKASIRYAPHITAEVYRTAKKGERFPISASGQGIVWYCIYDPQTLVEYWIHGNAIKIVAGKTKTAKTRQPVTQSKTNRTGKSKKQK